MKADFCFFSSEYNHILTCTNAPGSYNKSYELLALFFL